MPNSIKTGRSQNPHNNNKKILGMKQGTEITTGHAVKTLAEGVNIKTDMLSYVPKKSNDPEGQYDQGVELVHKNDDVDPTIPQGQDQSPKRAKTQTGKKMKGALFEKGALQTVTYGLGLYALWSNSNLLDDGINAIRKGADSITKQADLVSLEDQKMGSSFARNPFFSQIIEENKEQKSIYDKLFSATQPFKTTQVANATGADDSTQKSNTTQDVSQNYKPFSSMETEAVRELVEQSYYDELMLSDLQMATELENKLNIWVLEQKNLAALKEIDELKDDIEWLENEVESLNEDIRDYQQQIKELTKASLETRSKFTEALNRFDQFHRKIERVCDVLLKIPIVKKVGAVKGFCNASDDVRDILNSSRHYLQQTGRRRLEASAKSNEKYVNSWPPLSEKNETLHSLKLLTQLLEIPGFFPLTDKEFNNFNRLNNVTSVINTNEKRARNETEVYFKHLESHLTNFTKSATAVP